MKSIDIVEYYSVLKRNGILIYASIWMNLKDIILSEVNQKKKISYDINCMWSLKNKSNKYNKKESDSQIQRRN